MLEARLGTHSPHTASPRRGQGAHQSPSHSASPPGSLVLPQEAPLHPHVPGPLRACSGALLPPCCPWAPQPRQPPPIAPAPQRPITPLLSSAPRDPCLKPPLTSSSCDCLLEGFSHCPPVDSFLSCFHCFRHLHFDARQTRSLTRPQQTHPSFPINLLGKHHPRSLLHITCPLPPPQIIQ